MSQSFPCFTHVDFRSQFEKTLQSKLPRSRFGRVAVSESYSTTLFRETVPERVFASGLQLPYFYTIITHLNWIRV